MKTTLKSFNKSESRLPSLAKSSANGLDLTLSATKTASPLVLIANAKNTNLKAIINNKLAALNLSDYNAKMIMNRAEAMSCGGCHQNSSNAGLVARFSGANKLST
jgi:hypothetical protein